MSEYPSIISQEGSAGRNYPPILEAARPWIERAISTSTSTPKTGTRIFEIGSYPYTHIRGFASEYPNVEWYGSARDGSEVKEINERLQSSDSLLRNLHPPLMLDIADQSHWDSLRGQVEPEGSYDGVFMFNVIHCCPEGLPERVFRELSTKAILGEQGWIAVYGPYLADDGTYESPADEEFDRAHIRAKDGRLGLRSVPSITAFAQRWGFREVERKEMPKGNMWVVWQRASGRGTSS